MWIFHGLTFLHQTTNVAPSCGRTAFYTHRDVTGKLRFSKHVPIYYKRPLEIRSLR